VAGVVRVAGEDGRGAIELFGENEPGERVRKCEGTERKQEMGSLAAFIRPAACRADGKDKALHPFVAALSEPGSECFGGELLPKAVEQDHDRGASRLTGKGVEEVAFCAEGGDVTAGEGRQALQVDLSETFEGISGRITGANMSQNQVHASENTNRVEGESPKSRYDNEFLDLQPCLYDYP